VVSGPRRRVSRCYRLWRRKCGSHRTRRGPGFSSPEWQNIGYCGQ